MTTEIDAEGWEAAMRAFDGHHIGNTADGMNTYYGLSAAIRAYLSASRSTSEAEPVAWLRVEKPVYEGKPGRTAVTLDPEVAELWRQNDYTESLTPLGSIALPTPASDDQVEAVREAEAIIAALSPSNIAYERSVGDLYNWLGRLHGRIRVLAAMGSTKPAPRLDATVRSGEEG